MVDYGLKDRVAIITGINNPQGIGATTAYSFACEGAKLVLVYKKVFRKFNKSNVNKNGVDRYYAANAGDANILEDKLKKMNADFVVLERDISNENFVKEIYEIALTKYKKVDIYSGHGLYMADGTKTYGWSNNKNELSIQLKFLNE